MRNVSKHRHGPCTWSEALAIVQPRPRVARRVEGPRVLQPSWIGWVGPSVVKVTVGDDHLVFVPVMCTDVYYWGWCIGGPCSHARCSWGGRLLTKHTTGRTGTASEIQALFDAHCSAVAVADGGLLQRRVIRVRGHFLRRHHLPFPQQLHSFRRNGNALGQQQHRQEKTSHETTQTCHRHGAPPARPQLLSEVATSSCRSWGLSPSASATRVSGRSSAWQGRRPAP